jgi:hypothetical protein
MGVFSHKKVGQNRPREDQRQLERKPLQPCAGK